MNFQESKLHKAMKPNNGDQVSTLIANGCDVNFQGIKGRRVIESATYCFLGDLRDASGSDDMKNRMAENWRSTIEALVATNKIDHLRGRRKTGCSSVIWVVY